MVNDELCVLARRMAEGLTTGGYRGMNTCPIPTNK